MRVTNEQAECLIICSEYGLCEECRLYENGCVLKGRGVTFERELAIDFIEARELIKEMREVLNATRKTYSNEILTLAKMRIDEVLERTKEYAE